jgi:hypothetical protein
VYTLLGDESNRTSIDGEFFIYGGLVLETSKLGELSEGVARLRTEHQLPPGHPLKFSLSTLPEGWEKQQFHDLRSDVLRLATELGAKMIVYAVLHNVARTKSAEEVQRMGMNSILNRYSTFLEKKQSWGLAMLDQDNLIFKNIREIHRDGLIVDGKNINLGPQIASVLAFDANGSHLATVADLAVGAFRYCVNSLPKVGGEASISKMVASIHWYNELRNILPTVGGTVIDFSSPNVMFRPIEVNYYNYKVRYSELERHLNDLARNSNAKLLPTTQ